MILSIRRPALAFALILIAAGHVLAQKSEIFQKNNLAIAGYDVVAFHTEGRATMGNKMFSYHWKDADWLFASESNLEKFRVQPEKYAPQYGGYCAYGTADGHKAPTEPDTWTIDNNKLYFNYNKKVQTNWNKDRPAFIEKANTNWPAIKDRE